MAHVLVVDDEPDLRELLRVSLSLDGHEVSVAPDGLRGLESARKLRPDVVVLDVMMPGLDGWTVLSSIKSDPDPAVANIPVLMLTARTEDLDLVRGGIEGAVGYLTKPFALAELRQAVTDAIAGAPEPEQRRAAQQEALVRLARLESGSAPPKSPAAHPVAHLHLSRFEPVSSPGAPYVRGSQGQSPSGGGGDGRKGGADRAGTVGAVAGGGRQGVGGPRTAGGRRDPWPSWLSSERLTVRDQEIVQVVAAAANLDEARLRLSVSRSYLYASLRHIAAKLDIPSGPALVRALRVANAARERDLG